MTASPAPDGAVKVEPTQTSEVSLATPTRARQATPVPTKQAPAGSTATTEPAPTKGPGTPTPAPTATATPVPATATDTPAPGQITYPAPVLLEPPNDRPVSWRNTVVLEWAPVGELAVDEYYHLHLDRPPMHEGMEYYGDYVYLKDTSYVLQGAFLAPFHAPETQGEAIVYWWVQVVRKTGEDKNGKPVGIDIGELSEKRALILEPKPD